MNIDANASRPAPGFSGTGVDAGLRRYMLAVYNYLTIGLGVTGLVAYTAVATGLFQVIAGRSADLGGYAGATGGGDGPEFRIRRMSFASAQAMFWAYATLMGLSLGGVLLVYTGTSVARVFFVGAATFAGISLYGYSTGRDLSRIESFLMMGLVGIVLASIVNIFVASSVLQFAVSALGCCCSLASPPTTPSVSRVSITPAASETIWQRRG